MPAASLQITAFKHSQLANLIAAGDASFPKNAYFPGKLPVAVATAAELSALGAGWTLYPVAE